jgi:hypothetical protein
MRFRCHWSDNQNQLGTPVRVNKEDNLKAPFVYLQARNKADAEERIRQFNDQLEPTTGFNAAHIPLDLMHQHGMQIYF